MIWYGYVTLDLSRERDEMLAGVKVEKDRRFINLICSELYMFNKLLTIQPLRWTRSHATLGILRPTNTYFTIVDCVCDPAYGGYEVGSASTYASWTSGSHPRKQLGEGILCSNTFENQVWWKDELAPGIRRWDVELIG